MRQAGPFAFLFISGSPPTKASVHLPERPLS
jgi:hypothetical protein